MFVLAEFSIQRVFEEGLPLIGPLSPGWASLAAALLHAAFLINLFAILPLVYIWLERKMAGRIQDRLGPTRVGGKFGWLQTLADGIKLIQKEDLAPSISDRWIFRIAPYLAVIASFLSFMVIPFAPGWSAFGADCGVFLILALLSLEVFGIILGGYSSGSKWALFGAMREAAQMVSYEIPMAICALVPLVAAGTLNFGEIAQMQSGLFVNWLVFHNPFTFLAFFIYFTVATASVKRAPFDLAEAESELVAGFHTEYSGLRWSYFFMAEYASMFAVSAIASLLFLGGWNDGLGIVDGIRSVVGPVLVDVPFAGFAPGEFLANLICANVLVVKASLLVCVQIWVRWTVPRLRIDQVMTACLKYLVPIACFLFLGAILYPLMMATVLGRPSWTSAASSGVAGAAAVRATSSRVISATASEGTVR